MNIDKFKKMYEVLPPDCGKEEWLEARRCGITGTDIAAIVGLNPYRKVYDVFLDKLGLADDMVDTPYMKRGRRMEPILAEDYEEATGLKTVKVGLVRHAQCDFVLGTPDRLVVNGAGQILHGLEIKTAGYRQQPYWGPPETDIIPDQYLLQCQWYMLASGLDKWDLIVTIGGELPIVYHIQRNDDLVAKVFEIARKFWEENVLAKNPPSADESEAAARMLGVIYHRGNLDLVDGTDEDEALVSALTAKREELQKVEEEARLLENKIKERIGDHEGIKGGDWAVTWKKTKDRSSIDYGRLVKDLKITEDKLKEYTVVKEGYRVFRIQRRQ